MDERTLKDFRQNLIKHRDELIKITQKDIPNHELILNGTTMKDIRNTVDEIKNALERIEHGTFGQCKLCEDEVEIDRLHHDFTTQVCLGHYSDQQLRDLERDLELTVKIQRQLLPCCSPCIKNLQFAHYIKPAGIVGGDFYDFFNLPQGNQGLVIADVMGKGLPASMLLANLQASLKTLGPEHDSLSALACKINDLFRYNTTLIRFISMCLVGIDVNTNRIQYCNAGHHPPLFWHSGKKEIEWLKPTGSAIGLTHNAEYSQKTINVSKGDILILYTDGIVEARNKDGIEYGEKMLSEYVLENNDKPAQAFLDGLRQNVELYAGKFDDDIALMVIKF